MKAHEFSTAKMKEAVKNQSKKRVSKEFADHLGNRAHLFTESRAIDAREQARTAGRKTVKSEDFKDTRPFEVSSTSFDLPNAPVERLIRRADNERVSEGAVVELKSEVEVFITELVDESVKMADHANRNTVQAEDFEMAAQRVEP